MKKVFVDKKEAEKCLTYTRKFLGNSNDRDAYLEACHSVANNAVRNMKGGWLKHQTADTIKEVAWLTARYNSTNERFWAVLGYFEIYPKEVV